MSGSSGPRPYGIGPYGKGPYSRWGPTTYTVAGATGITFQVQAVAQPVHELTARSQIAFNVVSRGVSLVMHAEATTSITWDVQARFWQSWAALQPCQGGLWTPADPCEGGNWLPPPACLPGQWQTMRIGSP